MLAKCNNCQSDEHLRNFFTKTKNANSFSCCHSPSLCWALRGACFSPIFHFVPVKCLLLIILLRAGECQASGSLNLCLEIVLQCLLSELLWGVEISQGFFLLFSSFLFRDGSRAWCVLNKCADLELLVHLPTPTPTSTPK